MFIVQALQPPRVKVAKVLGRFDKQKKARSQASKQAEQVCKVKSFEKTQNEGDRGLWESKNSPEGERGHQSDNDEGQACMQALLTG